jgi:predicted nucleic acid-binding protein
VALARRLDVKLVTADKKVLKAFPTIATTLADAIG